MFWVVIVNIQPLVCNVSGMPFTVRRKGLEGLLECGGEEVLPSRIVALS